MASVTVKIYNSTRKKKLALIGSALFLLLGFILQSGKPDCTTVFLAYIVIFSLCFLASAYTLFKHLSNPQPAYVLNPEGLQINGHTHTNFIPWGEITGFNECKIKSRKFIAIRVTTPAEFIEQETNRLPKQIMLFNLQKFGTPFCISCAYTRSRHHEMWEMLHKFHTHYGKQAGDINPKTDL